VIKLETKDMKISLGNRAKGIIVDGLNLKLNKKGFALCPFHKEKTPSFSWDDSENRFKCFGCGELLDVFRYYTEFEKMEFTDAVKVVLELIGEKVETTHNVQPKKKYNKPNIQSRDLNEIEIGIWNKRGITKETLDHWQVKGFDFDNKEWMKFLYKDEKGNFPYANMRASQEPCPSDLKARPCGKSLKPILWGMWHIDTKSPLVITEGQPDAMAIWQSGYKNVVSVPAGASNLTWIENCFEWLNNFSEIYIYGDNDDAGIKMIENIKNRLGGQKVREVKHNYKDANEVYLKDGAEAIINDINEAFNEVPEGLSNISKVAYDYEESGIAEGIATGFKGLDYELEYLRPEEVSVVFGRTGEGKSTVVSQIVCNSIEQKQPVFLYSGEMGDKKVKRWLYRQACGMSDKFINYITRYIGGIPKAKKEIKPEVVKAINKWADNYFITLDKKSVSVRKEVENLFKTMEIAIKKYGCKLVIIDNLMSAIAEGDGHYFRQSNFMARCVEFANANGCHVMVVAHPNKTTDEGDALKKTSISGSGNIINMADLVIGVEKFTKEKTEACPTHIKVHGCMRLLKNREEGTGKEFAYSFNPTNKRLTEFLEIGNIESFDDEPNYSWEKYLEEYNPDPF
jgi:twinkle protein